MAVSQVQPLLLLLVSLFLLPVLLAVDFEYCNKSGYEFGNVTRVEISPNPVGPEDYELSITVFGYAKKSIDSGSIEVYAESEKITDLLRRQAYTIEAGTNFVLSLSEVFKDVLEGDYKYVVTLFDKKVGDSEKPIVRMCVDFSLPTYVLTLASA